MKNLNMNDSYLKELENKKKLIKPNSEYDLGKLHGLEESIDLYIKNFETDKNNRFRTYYDFVNHAKKLGFLPGVKIIDLDTDKEFTISKSLTINNNNKEELNKYYIGTLVGVINNKSTKVLVTIYNKKTGRWSKIIN